MAPNGTTRAGFFPDATGEGTALAGTSGSTWWHVAVVAVGVIVSVILFAADPPAWRLVGGLATIVTFVLAWFAIGRFAERDPKAALAFIVLVVLLCGTATAFYPGLATLQTVAFPLVWVLSASLRAAIVANFALAFSVGIGFVISNGTSAEALVQTTLTVLISLGFSLAMGLWITHIWRLSDERQALVEQLQATQAQLAALHRDAGVASERERLARELHDTIAQSLTGLVMLAQRAQRELRAGDVSGAGERLGLLEESARDTLAETRALVASSAPVELAAGGIRPALERLAQRFSKETGVAVTLESGEAVAVPRDSEVVLLRCCQEALSNVRKHSGARSATVSLTVADSAIVLRIADDGSGFDPDAVDAGFGLTGMRDRLALVGGALQVSSTSTGTVLVATLPLAVTA